MEITYRAPFNMLISVHFGSVAYCVVICEHRSVKIIILFQLGTRFWIMFFLNKLIYSNNTHYRKLLAIKHFPENISHILR